MSAHLLNLAKEWVWNNRTADLQEAYEAGFLKAREMGVDAFRDEHKRLLGEAIAFTDAVILIQSKIGRIGDSNE